MTKEKLIEKTIEVINQLPSEKAEEIYDFADFLLKRFEEQSITSNIQQIVTDSKAFFFLEEDEVLYTAKDIKEKYNG
jgi:hypothetical protein